MCSSYSLLECRNGISLSFGGTIYENSVELRVGADLDRSQHRAMQLRIRGETIWNQRVLVAVVASTLVSSTLALCPVYAGNSGSTLIQVNGPGASIVLVPILLSAMAWASDRLRILAGVLMLGWGLVGAFTVGLFYLPVAIWLLWPSKRHRVLRDCSASPPR